MIIQFNKVQFFGEIPYAIKKEASASLHKQFKIYGIIILATLKTAIDHSKFLAT